MNKEIVKKQLWRIASTFVMILLTLTINAYLFIKLSENQGFYLIFPKVVGIQTKDMNMLDLRMTVNHELGHYLWYNCLPKAWKEKYNQIYLNSSCRLYVNKTTEDFADIYSRYQTGEFDSKIPSSCLAKINYFEELESVTFGC